MGIDDTLREKRDEILRVAARHGVSRIHVFGSVARGEATEESDYDFLMSLLQNSLKPTTHGRGSSVP